MKYLFVLIGGCLLITLQENILWLILGGVIWVLYIHLFYDSTYSQPWRNDVCSWAEHYYFLHNDPVLKTIEDKYIRVSEELHEIDYRLLDDNLFQRPRQLIYAIINKYGLSDKFKELSAKKQKIKEEYLLAEKLIGIDHIQEKKIGNISGKTRPLGYGKKAGHNAQPTSTGKYTLF